MPAYLQIKTSGDNLVLTSATGTAVETWATSKGLEGRKAATGASGYVTISASVGASISNVPVPCSTFQA